MTLEKTKDKERIEELFNKRNQYIKNSQTQEEVKVLKEIEKLILEVYGYESDENIKILNELGGTLKYTGDFENAEKSLIKAKDIITKKYGTNNISYATCILNLAEVYRFMKKLDEIEPLYLKTIEIYENNNLQNDYLYASVCNNLGLFYQELEQYEKALLLHKKSLAILEKLPEKKLQYATTLSNMVLPYLKTDNKIKSEEYSEKSLKLIEKEVGKEHNLYSASLNNLAIIYFNEGDFEKALDLFRESAIICKKSFGENSTNYKNLLSNIEYAEELLSQNNSLEKKDIENNKVNDVIESRKNIYNSEFDSIIKNSENKTDNNKNIKGLLLSKKYFEEVCLPVIKEKFSELYNRMAIGLVGEGSECFGFDDAISQDHDFGPTCCIWLNDKDYEKYGKELSKVLDELPKEFMGFGAIKNSEYTGKRRGVFSISSWYNKYLGTTTPKIEEEWEKIPEEMLATVINGEVFVDNLGEFTAIRNKIKSYFPDNVRREKISKSCMKISQSGQYNYLRCIKRNETVAAKLAETEFIQEVMNIVYLLNRRYRLFYKWIHRGLLELSIIGKEIYKLLDELCKIDDNNTNKKIDKIEEICTLIINELKNQNLAPTNMKSDFLQDYAPIIQQNLGYRISLINEILEREWIFFQMANNRGGRAECQDNKEEFIIMRNSQWKTLPLYILESYLEDLKVSEIEKRNIVVEKYARMMKYSSPEEYEEIKDSLPEIEEDKKKLVDKIVLLYLDWEREIIKRYPKIASKGRPLNSKDDIPERVSIETYFRGELYSYSLKTVRRYYEYIKDCKSKNVNLALENIKNIALEKGYKSLEDAENRVE